MAVPEVDLQRQRMAAAIDGVGSAGVPDHPQSAGQAAVDVVAGAVVEVGAEAGLERRDVVEHEVAGEPPPSGFGV